MIEPTAWLTKLILSHLLTDFILQPNSWVQDRQNKHFLSPKLYLHGAVTVLLALFMIGISYWPTLLVILISHVAIDGWKSYQRQTAAYFLIDQALHLLVIFICWYATFFNTAAIASIWQQLNQHPKWWKAITGFVFVTVPAGILIGQLTRQWRDKIENAESLANAGKWIGMAERTIILIFVLQNQFAAIGLLVAAKGIIRFNEKDRPEVKTEYLVVGTLLSIVIAVVTGLLIQL